MKYALTLLLAVVLVACDQSAPNKPETADPTQRYETRGEVKQVLDEGLIIFHEAIPGFIGVSGEKVGMPAHPMELTLGEGEAADVKPGDIISFTLCVVWKPEAKSWIEGVTKLPADTKLDLGEQKADDGHAGHGHDHHDHAGHDHGAHDHHDHAGHDH